MVTNDRLTRLADEVASPEVYRDGGYPWAAWDVLRREAPVFRHENHVDLGRNWGSVWLITKYADIMEISKNPATWNQHHTQREPVEGVPQHHIIGMDPPEHGVYRNLLNRRFMPRALAPLAPDFEAAAVRAIEDVVDRLFDPVRGEGCCDFVRDIAARLPVYAICSLMGVPLEDGPSMFQWASEISGADDPEYQRGRTRQQTFADAQNNMTGYFSKLAEERRRQPREDLMTVLVQSEIDGQPLPEQDLVQYAWILMQGGNSTTRNATAGGMLTLIEHPDEMARLRADPSLAASATEEILRWVSPLVSFGRTAARETVIRGQQIQAGESVALYYASANRDEDVFEDPYRFDITRQPNNHLAFGGYGEHFCIGANLARLELNIVFRELLQRLPEIELDGPPERLLTAGNSGFKRMPVKFKPRRNSGPQTG